MAAPEYVMVRNLARSPLARVKRVTRPGGRRTGFTLSDGRRMRRGRTMTVGAKELLANAERLAAGVRDAFIEVKDPSGKTLGPDELLAMVGMKAPAPPPPVEEPVVEEVPEPEGAEEPVAEDVEGPEIAEVLTKEELEAMQWNELKAKAKDMDINTHGIKKDDLIELAKAEEG